MIGITCKSVIKCGNFFSIAKNVINIIQKSPPKMVIKSNIKYQQGGQNIISFGVKKLGKGLNSNNFP